MMNGNRHFRFVFVQIRELRQFFHAGDVAQVALQARRSSPNDDRNVSTPHLLNEAQICEEYEYKEIIVELVISHYRFDSE